MVQRRGGARLLLEALAALGVGRELRREDLDRDVAAEAGVAGAIDLSHPARADRREDLEGPELGAGGECHSCVAGILTRLT